MKQHRNTEAPRPRLRRRGADGVMRRRRLLLAALRVWELKHRTGPA